MQLQGRQTQFYIDLIYGIGFAVGFGYLIFVGMNPMVAAFQSGLVLGYFLRVWENMSVYERILQEEVAAEAEEAVAHEIEDTMPDEIKKRVGEQMKERLQEMGERVPEHAKKREAGRLASEEKGNEPPRSAQNRGDGAPSGQQSEN